MDDKRKCNDKFSDNEDHVSVEGTAARTRPCSIEDIILRRYSKKLMQDAKDSNKKVKSELVKVGENISDHLQQKEEARNKKGFNDEKGKSSGKRDEKRFSSNFEHAKKSEKVACATKVSSTIKEIEKTPHSESRKMSTKDSRGEKRGHQHIGAHVDDKVGFHSNESSKERSKKRDIDKQKEGKKDRLKEEVDQKKYEDDRSGRKIYDNEARRKDGKRKRDDEKEKSLVEMDRISKRRNGSKSQLSEKVAKRENDEYYERKEKNKESAHSFRHNDGRGKQWKRSPSSDFKRNKEHGRSISPTVRPSKRYSSHHGRDHNRERTYHRSSPEKLDIKHEASDRNEKEKGGHFSSHTAHYRRYGGGSSGLGGYSPRKRRSDTAVKTPSPPARSPERKPGWDLTPGGLDSNMVAAMVAAYQASTQQLSSLSSASVINSASTSISLQKPTTTPVVGQSTSHPPASLTDTVELTQSTRPSRRLYITNLPSSVTEGELTDFLNSAMLSASSNHLPGTKPCISCVVNLEKNQAFAEFLTPEDASAAILLDGKMFRGTGLKIKRPKDFVEPANGVMEKVLPTADSVSMVVNDSPNKIFIGGIPHTMSSKKVKDIVTAFGQLKAFHMEVNKNNKPPHAFVFLELQLIQREPEILELFGVVRCIKYSDPSITLKACAGLNGFKLGGRLLTVVQATPDASLEDESIPCYDVPEHAKPLMQKPTRVLELKNVVTKEELQHISENELEEIIEDVRLECMRFGTVKSVNIARGNEDDLKFPITSNHGGNLELIDSEGMEIHASETLPVDPVEAKSVNISKDNEGDLKCSFTPDQTANLEFIHSEDMQIHTTETLPVDVGEAAKDLPSFLNSHDNSCPVIQKDPIILNDDILARIDPVNSNDGVRVQTGTTISDNDIQAQQTDSMTSDDGVPVKTDPINSDDMVPEQTNCNDLSMCVNAQIKEGDPSQCINMQREEADHSLHSIPDTTGNGSVVNMNSNNAINIGCITQVKHEDRTSEHTELSESEVGYDHSLKPENGHSHETTVLEEFPQHEADGHQSPRLSSAHNNELHPEQRSHDDVKSQSVYGFEVASVFVEFSRTEGACLAAHNLHGRQFGSRKVSAGYFPEIAYQKGFSRFSTR